MSAATIAYPFKKGIYLNITNRCPTACRFCLKRLLTWRFEQWNFRLPQPEPGAAQIIAAIDYVAQTKEFREVVFCGYGESTCRLAEMQEVCAAVRRHYPRASLRLNTIGLGNLMWGQDIVPELARMLDAVAVSLNTADAGQWLEIHAPLRQFREQGFKSVLGFVRGCVAAGLRTSVTAVALPEVALAAVRKLAAELGAGFRSRPAL